MSKYESESRKQVTVWTKFRITQISTVEAKRDSVPSYQNWDRVTMSIWFKHTVLHISNLFSELSANISFKKLFFLDLKNPKFEIHYQTILGKENHCMTQLKPLTVNVTRHASKSQNTYTSLNILHETSVNDYVILTLF